MAITERACVECGSELYGRSDQKFCSDACRNAWHNKQRAGNTPYMRKVSGILRKNRNILLDLNPDKKRRLHKRKLEEKGFDFRFFTNTYTTKNGDVYYFCFEQGYKEFEDGYLVLVEQEATLPV